MTQGQFETVQFVSPVRRFMPFEGANHKRMRDLLTGKDSKTGAQVDVPRQLITPKTLMEARLGKIGAEGDKAYLRSVYVDTRFAVLPDPESDAVKIVPNDALVYTLNAESELVNYNLPISKDHYEAQEGFEFNVGDANTLRGNVYAVPNVREAFWEFAAEGDISLKTDYQNDITPTLNNPFAQVMGIYLLRSKGLRLLSVGSVGDRSYAGGIVSLDYGGGRLVGVAPEAQVAQKIAQQAGLEARVQSALDAGQSFEYKGKVYVAVVDPRISLKQ